jgi:acetoacetate decarboxylase
MTIEGTGRLNPIGGGYSLPIDSPLYDAGTKGWAYRDSFFVGVMYETDTEAFLDILPEGLTPAHNPPRVFIWGLENRTAGLGDFYEMKIEMIVKLGDEVFVYCPYIMVSAMEGGLAPDAAMAVGREVIGAPKKIGQIRFQRDSGHVTAALERPIGNPVAKITVAPKEQLSPEELGISEHTPDLYLRVIPNVEGGKPSVAQLVRYDIPISFDETQTFRGSGSVSFGESPEDPWHRLRVVNVLDGITAKFSLDIPPTGQVVIDYLAQSEGDSSEQVQELSAH